jgi:hypothetical protein
VVPERVGVYAVAGASRPSMTSSGLRLDPAAGRMIVEASSARPHREADSSLGIREVTIPSRLFPACGRAGRRLGDQPAVEPPPPPEPNPVHPPAKQATCVGVVRGEMGGADGNTGDAELTTLADGSLTLAPRPHPGHHGGVCGAADAAR